MRMEEKMLFLPQAKQPGLNAAAEAESRQAPITAPQSLTIGFN